MSIIILNSHHIKNGTIKIGNQSTIGNQNIMNGTIMIGNPNTIGNQNIMSITTGNQSIITSTIGNQNIVITTIGNQNTMKETITNGNQTSRWKTSSLEMMTSSCQTGNTNKEETIMDNINRKSSKLISITLTSLIYSRNEYHSISSKKCNI